MKEFYYKRKIKIFIFLAFACAGFFCIQSVIAQEKININIASLAELDTLPGIGPAKAQAIISYRETSGLFKTIEEIINVVGIGSATFNDIKELITVDAMEKVEANKETENKVKDPPEATSLNKEAVSYKIGSVVINEFVSDPADGEEEWIEFFNNTNGAISLTGWTIEEGSGEKTNLAGSIAESGENKFLVLEKPKGNLNNKGDIIILRDPTGKLIDQVSYGDWNDGDLANNAPAVSDPGSTARKIDGQNNYNNFEDFIKTSFPTKGKNNIIKNNEGGEEGVENIYDYSNEIIISEIFPNPKGDDREGEFIEIFNKGEREVDLSGWEITDSGESKYKFKEEKIKSGEYLAILRKESKVVLNNSSDSVKIFQPNKEKPLQTVKYKEAKEGWSYNLREGGYAWSEVVTPGKANIIKAINHSPKVDFDCPEEAGIGAPILFDSSDTVDEDGDKLKYEWDFGDGMKNNLVNPEHAFLKTGNYKVTLKVSDGTNEVKKAKIVKVISQASNIGETLTQNINKGEVVINEILPNPEGSDADGEWIEISNRGKYEINLLGWKAADKSKDYKFLENIFMPANSFYVLDRSESDLALNNNMDSVRLYDDSGELFDEIKYESAKEGVSYARDNSGKWFWTNVLTPGDDNEIIKVESSKSAKKKINKYGKFIETTLEKIKEFEIGDLIKVKGTVAVLPGILGSQYFYIVGSPGIQVYNYKKDFPTVKVGDYVEVSGELSQISGEARLKIKKAEDIKIIESRGEPSAQELSCEKIDEEAVGCLVKIAGEITEKKGSILYLDDGTGESTVYIKKGTGINIDDFKIGDKISLSGIVSKTKSGERILPRQPSDIALSDSKGRVLGEVSESDEWEISGRNKKLELFKYLLILAGGAIVILGALLTRKIINDKYNNT